MSTAVSILVTVALVAGGIGAYHVVIAEDGPTPSSMDPISFGERDLAGLEDRLAALEGRGPILQGSSTPQDLYDRLNALTERLAAIEQAGPSAARVTADATLPAPDATAAAAGNEVVSLPDGTPSPLTAAQEKRVRDLLGESMRSRFQRGNRGRIDRTLNELGIELSDDQKKKLDTAMSEHFTKVRDMFRGSRDSGQSRDELMQQVQELNQGFTQKITEFIPAGDAEAIGASLTNFGGDRGRGGNRR